MVLRYNTRIAGRGQTFSLPGEELDITKGSDLGSRLPPELYRHINSYVPFVSEGTETTDRPVDRPVSRVQISDDGSFIREHDTARFTPQYVAPRMQRYPQDVTVTPGSVRAKPRKKGRIIERSQYSMLNLPDVDSINRR